jgi:hypothetical protein
MSTPVEPPTPHEAALDTLAALAAAIDEVVALARTHVQVFDVDLAQGGWSSVRRAEVLGAFLRRGRHTKLDVIVHETRFLETSLPRIVSLLRLHSHAVTVYRTGSEARNAMDPLVIADGRHFVHRFHVDRPRAALAIEQPLLTRPLAMRFEQIWATGEPGLPATVLGL